MENLDIDDPQALSYFDREGHHAGMVERQGDSIAVGSGTSRRGIVNNGPDDELDEVDDFGEFTAAQIKVDQNSQYTPSVPSITERTPGQHDSPFFAPTTNGSPYKRPPYLHPSVSRLRSHYRNSSSSTISTLPSDPYLRMGPSPSPRLPSGVSGLHQRTPSMLSDGSRQSSFHHPYGASSGFAGHAGGLASPSGKRGRPGSIVSAAGTSDIDRGDVVGSLQTEEQAGETMTHTSRLLPAFRWQTLKKASETLFDPRPESATSGDGSSPRRSMLGGPNPMASNNQAWGTPTRMAVNGVIAIGTSGGWTIVFSFNQEIKHVLGLASICKDAGPVTAISISPDQTYVGVGHEQGQIYLYDLTNPSKPARTAAPLPLQALATGRKEGHLSGTRIVTVNFVGKRHTAIISGDESGRAFWWSLGKVMGVESNDVVRLLGNTPLPANTDGLLSVPGSPSRPGSTFAAEGAESPRQSPSRSLCAAAPLPLGPRTHFSDTYSFTALLTPSKLVIIGLQPSPRTWYRKVRKRNDAVALSKGWAAWLPAGTGDVKDGQSASEAETFTKPMLAYSWGRDVFSLAIEESRDTANGDSHSNGSTGPPQPTFIDRRGYSAHMDILSIDWYDARHLLIRTEGDLTLLDVRSMRPVDQSYLPGATRKRSTETLSLSAYRGRLFLLASNKLGLGTLSTWADRILALCQTGEYLAAIDLATAYYRGQAPGNDIGLPEEAAERKVVLHDRLIDLMRSSLDYAFAEERMTDGTYHESGSAGVDLTSLFESLADACLSACEAMDDMTFAYEDVFDRYVQVGIDGVYLRRLEQHVFETGRREISPDLVQALLKRHYDAGEYDEAEALIWQVDPASLDVNQATRICQEKQLLDAYIYIHNSCLDDYVSPIAFVARLMDRVLDQRENGPQVVGEPSHGQPGTGADGTGKISYEVYKVYDYLEKALCGCSYPDARSASDRGQQDIYTYLFRNNTNARRDQPVQELTGQDTLRILYLYDPEAFLHVLDIAFEDPYLNDAPGPDPIDRQEIVEILLDFVRGLPYRQGNLTFLYIFIARNLPKYPQFISLPSAEIGNILDGLAKDEDQSTLADREYAAEFLLSNHTPRDPDVLHALFDKAGFFRILQTLYRRDRRWTDLIDVLMRDPEATGTLFSSLEGVCLASQSEHATVVDSLRQSLPALLDSSVSQTALMLDRNASDLHETSLELLADRPDRRLTYYRTLLEPTLFLDDALYNQDLAPRVTASRHITAEHKIAYLQLLLAREPSTVIGALAAQPVDFYALDRVLSLVEDLPLVSIWILNRMDESGKAVALVADTVNLEGMQLVQNLELATSPGSEEHGGALERGMLAIQDVLQSGVKICQDHGQAAANSPVSVAELWLTLLEAEVRLVRSVNSSQASHKGNTASDAALERVVHFLRGTIQDTFTSLIASSSADAVPFPELFRRLVESAHTDDSDTTGTPYGDFRVILTSMLNSYSGEGESMRLAAKIFGADLHDLIVELLRRQARGWKAISRECGNCEAEYILQESRRGGIVRSTDGPGVLVSAEGKVTHILCPFHEP